MLFRMLNRFKRNQLTLPNPEAATVEVVGATHVEAIKVNNNNSNNNRTTEVATKVVAAAVEATREVTIIAVDIKEEVETVLELCTDNKLLSSRTKEVLEIRINSSNLKNNNINQVSSLEDKEAITDPEVHMDVVRGVVEEAIRIKVMDNNNKMVDLVAKHHTSLISQ